MVTFFWVCFVFRTLFLLFRLLQRCDSTPGRPLLLSRWWVILNGLGLGLFNRPHLDKLSNFVLVVQVTFAPWLHVFATLLSLLLISSQWWPTYRLHYSLGLLLKYSWRIKVICEAHIGHPRLMNFAEGLLLNVSVPNNVTVPFNFFMLFLGASSISADHADIIPHLTDQIIKNTQLVTLGFRLPVINVQCFGSD